MLDVEWPTYCKRWITVDELRTTESIY